MKSWLEKNDIEMYLRHIEGKSIIAERFIRALKNRIYKYATLVSKSGFIDKLDDIVNKYNNTYHSTIKMKHSDVKSNTYSDSSKTINDKIANLKLVIMLEYQNTKIFFAKDYTRSWSEEVFVIKKVKNTVRWTYVINGLNGEKIVGAFYEKD